MVPLYRWVTTPEPAGGASGASRWPDDHSRRRVSKRHRPLSTRPPMLSPRLLPLDSTNAATLQLLEPGPEHETTSTMTAPHPDATASLPCEQPRVPEASIRPLSAGAVTNQYFLCGRLRSPKVVEGPLTSAENTLLVVNDNLLKSADEGPQDQSGEAPTFCQFIFFLFFTAATILFMCLLLFESSFNTPTSGDNPESTTGWYASFRLEVFPGVRERGVVTWSGTTNGTDDYIYELSTATCTTETASGR
ncbi:hypothetical protein MTO96_027466 [Rhipicephalus appendiculatus]